MDDAATADDDDDNDDNNDDDDDDDDDDDVDEHSSNVTSHHDGKVQSTNAIKNENDDKTSNENCDSLNLSRMTNHPTITSDYTRHRERLAKELKDYEDRWLAHRNFLLYTQSFAMKPENRERLFSQLNMNHNDNTNEENSPLHQLQIQQQLFYRLSKEERDRFLAAALYQQQQQQQQQQQNPYNFHAYSWTNQSNHFVDPFTEHACSLRRPATTSFGVFFCHLIGWQVGFDQPFDS